MQRRATIASLCIAFVLSSALLPPARAQCDYWAAGPLARGMEGVGKGIYASLQYDPDGNGPTAPLLIVGGDFTDIAGVRANYIAAYDGVQWRALGSGTNGPVYALIQHNNTLVVGGSFSAAGAVATAAVARWTGGLSGTWSAIGGGLPAPSGSGFPSSVFSLAVYHSFLYAGGARFLGFLPGVDGGLARFDGTTWQVVGDGIYQARVRSAVYAEPAVRSMLVYLDQLIIGGGFALDHDVDNLVHLASWDETHLRRLGPVFGNNFDTSDYWPVHAMAYNAANLVIGGSFHQVGGGLSESVFGWDGQRIIRMGGVNAQTPTDGGICCFSFHDGALIAGGDLQSAGGQAASGLVRFNGADWEPYAGQFRRPYAPTVRTLTNTGTTLLAGGEFERVETATQSISAQGLAMLSGGSWSNRLGSSATIYALTKVASRVIAGGDFAAHDDAGYGANYLIGWNGAVTSTLSGHPNAPVRALYAYPVAADQTALVVGGDFTTIRGDAAPHIARSIVYNEFDVGTWEPLGDGLNSTVYAIDRYGSGIAAGGSFTASGATAVNRLARFGGTAWTTIGGGVNGTVRAIKVVNALSDTIIFVGGSFTLAGTSTTVSNVASFTDDLNNHNAGTWSAMGGGLNGTVRAIEVYDGTTFAAGDFTASGATPLARIAYFSAGAWHPLGAGVNGPVYALRSEGGYLYVAGAFTTAGSIPVHNIARWNGAAWSDVRGGVDSTVFALTAFQNEVHAAGILRGAGNPALPSVAWGRYLETGVPWIAVQPSAVPRDCRLDYAPTFAVAEGYTDVQLQWRKNGVPLANGTTGRGSFITGADGQLVIHRAGDDDEGNYDCVVSTSCGSATSAADRLIITSECPVLGDMNCDGRLDNFDIDPFVLALVSPAAYAAAYPDCDPLHGDVDGSGALTNFDIEPFVAVLVGE